MNHRIEQLLEFIETEPNEPFNRYALALEYINFDINLAQKHFEILKKQQPDYLPLYYHLGKLYEEKENYSMALEIYKQGIELARMQNNSKTEKELSNALNNCVLENM
ncbi:MAG: tetratricopeptide repeat protein [Bacteroidetes bacterium]|nr:MAG: tetratricopeptide repeat protein [Bacteroidota bacterium]TAG86845.1 MAG: tetratricopeptide repeat protein [Bacteroidota bacterium]